MQLSAGHPRRGLAKGFSLLELVMVVAIVGIVSAIAVPRYSAAACNYRAEVAARRVAKDIGLAQSRARTLSASQTITFNTSTGQYSIAGMTNPDRPASAYTVKLGDPPYQALLVSVTIGAGTSLTFNGYGVPSSGGTIVLQAGAAQRTVVIDPTTGAATVQ
jgi:prepilin-type N-terminal cleavage/methylation domain-containing protein